MDGQMQKNLEVISDVLVQGLLQEEEKLDNELKKLEKMNEDDLDALREKRLLQMKKNKIKLEKFRAMGHGEYQEITDQKEFFESAKKSEKMVCHFYRDSTPRCKIVDKHLSLIAKKHLECRFIKCNAEKSPFLVERLGVIMLPTITCVIKGKVVHGIIGFDEMGGVDDFPTQNLQYVLAHHKLINYEGPAPDSPRGSRKQVGRAVRQRQENSDSDESD